MMWNFIWGTAPPRLPEYPSSNSLQSPFSLILNERLFFMSGGIPFHSLFPPVVFLSSRTNPEFFLLGINVQVGRRYQRPGRNHGGATTGIGAGRLKRVARERLTAGIPVVIARQTGRRFGRLLERLPAVFLLPRRCNT